MSLSRFLSRLSNKLSPVVDPRPSHEDGPETESHAMLKRMRTWSAILLTAMLVRRSGQEIRKPLIGSSNSNPKRKVSAFQGKPIGSCTGQAHPLRVTVRPPMANRSAKRWLPVTTSLFPYQRRRPGSRARKPKRRS